MYKLISPKIFEVWSTVKSKNNRIRPTEIYKKYIT